ncbi:SDR family NAD(P)-dependent oxidoreductase [Luteibaculum oceani]|uniref:SDR family oxidoreductase n=1 Tax=Luteibaculum oceani TaxID=1294296 RepID=A0A5C6UU96_9FLAO|nr:SDR family oxidoreductase [Luteibaculum oceani]TXC76190.1 SDR family oxidoreductase [Luteibaculum oceani]
MKKLLIVGASHGIGAAIFNEIKEEYEVITISREEPEYLGDSTHHKLDIIKDELPEISKLDALIYCPGSINLKPIRSLDEADFKADFEINVLGAVKTIKHYFKALKKGENSSILLFSTVAVAQGMPFHASVAASKAAVEGLGRSLAAEFAPTIRVNTIAPTVTDTPLASSLLRNEEAYEKLGARHPMKRVIQSEEIAALAAFLISSKAKNITGQTLRVDGGLSTIKL